jgi:hypothetical protein
VADFYLESRISCAYLPAMASRSSRIRCRKKYHNQGREHRSWTAIPNIGGQLAHRKTSRSAGWRPSNANSAPLPYEGIPRVNPF